MKRSLTLSLVLTSMAATADAHEDNPKRLIQVVAMFAPDAIIGIPITPFAAEAPRRVDNLGPGVALNGVRIDGPAPADAILAAHTIAPFDDCGGHVNLGVGYHYHAVTSCSKEVSAAVVDHAPIIDIAMDGHILHAQLDADGMEPSDLDACHGHEVERIGYHYHANGASQNSIMICHAAQVGCSNSGSDTSCDATQPLRRNRPGAGAGGD